MACYLLITKALSWPVPTYQYSDDTTLNNTQKKLRIYNSMESVKKMLIFMMVCRVSAILVQGRDELKVTHQL